MSASRVRKNGLISHLWSLSSTLSGNGEIMGFFPPFLRGEGIISLLWWNKLLIYKIKKLQYITAKCYKIFPISVHSECFHFQRILFFPIKKYCCTWELIIIRFSKKMLLQWNHSQLWFSFSCKILPYFPLD